MDTEPQAQTTGLSSGAKAAVLVVRDIALIFSFFAIGAFIVRSIGEPGAPPSAVAIAVGKLLSGVIGFAFSGSMARGNRCGWPADSEWR